MIIWGSKGREIVEDEGLFFCPECRKEVGYRLKRVGQYFTLYFIPVFQMKEIGKFVECIECLNQFKLGVLDYNPLHNLSFLNNEEDKRRISSACSLFQMHMALSLAMYEDELQGMNHDQRNKYLAFELGVIEYYNSIFLGILGEDESDTRLLCFMEYCSKSIYGDRSEAIFQLWRSLVAHGLMYRERELGYNSVSNKTNPDGTMNQGHFPGVYLKEAIGF